MIITHQEQLPFREEAYQIMIPITNDIDGVEIAECFKEQYPNTRCVICFRDKTLEGDFTFGFIILGIKLKYITKK